VTLRARIIRFVGVLFSLSLFVGAAATAAPQPAAAVTYAPISGSGSTWSQNALDQWRRNVATNYSMTINYNGQGSSAGRRDFVQGTVDFAVSEIPFQSKPEDGSAPEKPANGFAYMPIVAGGTAFMYNLKIGGKLVTNLRLSGETITKIFTGVITNWNDPVIKADNPGLAMPTKPIVPVVRSDGSGSTAQFTLWMSKQHSALWNNFCKSVQRPVPCGLTSQYPTFGNAKAQNGSLGVAGYVNQDYAEGAITYVEYSYALKSGFPVAKVLNSSGYYVEPTAPSVAVALLQAKINDDPSSPDYLTQILDGVYNNADKRTYPLSSYSYMIVPTTVAGIFTAAKGNTLGNFARYMLCDGQDQAADLGYSPLPMNLVLAGFTQIARIPGAGTADINPDSCKNPTFKKGDSPANNQLALSAPQPDACDKKGPEQCATGTGGAKKDTPVTDKKGTPAGGAPTPTAGGSTAGPGVVDGADPGSSGDVAASAPFTLASSAWGGGQFLMLGAGVLLIVAIVLPPLLSKRLKRQTPPSHE
jgi:phosphate transport system substrate-binding protein